MEYALGAATVSIAWSEYLNNLLGHAIPYEWCHSPFESMYNVSPDIVVQIQKLPGHWDGIEKGILSAAQYENLPANLASKVTITSGFINAPALIILLALTLLLIKGTKEWTIIKTRR
jgi:APA family basic amino acid/polyamine antiporter